MKKKNEKNLGKIHTRKWNYKTNFTFFDSSIVKSDEEQRDEFQNRAEKLQVIF